MICGSHDLPCLLTTAVDRTLKVYRSDSFDLVDSYDLPSPALSIAQYPGSKNARLVACATMEGSLSVIDLVSRQVVARVKDHTKVRHYHMHARLTYRSRFTARSTSSESPSRRPENTSPRSAMTSCFTSTAS